MIPRHSMLAALVIGPILATALGAQTLAEVDASPRRGPFDLSIQASGRAVLVEVHENAKGKINYKRGPTELVRELDHSADARWLDEVGASGGSAVRHRRSFIEFRKSNGDQVMDPGLEGASVEITRVDEDVKARSRDSRQLTKLMLRKQVALEPAIGLWVELPSRAMLGEEFQLAAETLLATILDIENDLSAFACQVKLDRVEEGRAHLSGTAAFSSSFETNGLSTTSRYEGKLVLEVDLATHLVANVSYAGAATMNGRGASAGKISGEVTFEARGSANIATDPAVHRVKKPKFRQNVHVFDGLRFEMPSYWVRVPEEQRGTRLFRDSRQEDNAAIEIRLSEDRVDPTDPLFIEGFTKVGRREAPDIKVVKATFPIGDGLTFECTADTGQKVRGLVAPFAGGLARFRMVGSANAIRRADADMKVIQATLSDAN